MDFSILKGKTLISIEGEEGDDQMVFNTDDGEQYRLKYYQDCCAHCDIEDIVGDLSDLIGNPLLLAEEVQGDAGPLYDYDDSFTWVYYKLDTIKGGVTLRWYGSSNGYYSEAATFERLR